MFVIGLEASALLGFSAAPVVLEYTSLSALMLVLVGIFMPMVVAVSIVPLEYLLHTVRPVMGSLVQVIMHLTAMLLRLLAASAIDLGRAAVILYDAVIFLPLGIEAALQRRQRSAADDDEQALNPAPQPAEAENVTALRFGAASPRRD